MNIISYPKIWNLGNNQIPNLLESNVEVTEKVDGSMLRWTLTKEGVLLVGSKSVQSIQDHANAMFKAGVEYLETITNKMTPGFTYFGEYLRKPKHNTLTYDKIPKNHIVLFGTCFENGMWETEWKYLSNYAEVMGIDVVPLLFKGLLTDQAALEELLKTQSYLGGQTIEGVVIKNYEQNSRNVYSPECFGKYVRASFKELNGAKHTKSKNSLMFSPSSSKISLTISGISFPISLLAFSSSPFSVRC